MQDVKVLISKYVMFNTKFIDNVYTNTEKCMLIISKLHNFYLNEAQVICLEVWLSGHAP